MSIFSNVTGRWREGLDQVAFKRVPHWPSALPLRRAALAHSSIAFESILLTHVPFLPATSPTIAFLGKKGQPGEDLF